MTPDPLLDEARALLDLETNQVQPGEWSVEEGDREGAIIVRDNPAVTERVFTGFNTPTVRFLAALRNFVGSGKLLALVERTEKDRTEQLDVQLAGCLTAAEGYISNPATNGTWGWSPAYQAILELRQKSNAMQARIESLEAERDIWKNRAQHGRYEIGGPFPDPTPAEIAARVEENRKKERTRCKTVVDVKERTPEHSDAWMLACAIQGLCNNLESVLQSALRLIASNPDGANHLACAVDLCEAGFEQACGRRTRGTPSGWTRRWRGGKPMGDRYFITVQCPKCGQKSKEDDVYYASTCGFTTYKCTCGYVVDLEAYTGILELHIRMQVMPTRSQPAVDEALASEKERTR